MKTDEPLEKFIKDGILEFDRIKAGDELKSVTLRKIERASREDKLVAEYEGKVRSAQLRLGFFKACATTVMLAFVITAVVSVCLGEGYALTTEESECSIVSGVDEISELSKSQVIFHNNWNEFASNALLVENYSGNLSSETLEDVIGIWDDNENWFSPFSINSLNDDKQSYNAFQNSFLNLNNRLKVNVVTKDGHVVSGAYVSGYNDSDELVFSSLTDNEGVAYLFGNILGNEPTDLISYIRVVLSGSSVTCNVSDEEDITVEIDVPNKSNTENTLEIMFSVCTKQSMEEEFEVLSKSIDSIIEKIKSSHPDLKIRMGVNFYRNFQEEYFVRSFPFYDDPQIAIEILKQQQCSGGGNYSDSFCVALYDAVYSHEWTDGAAAKLLFIIYDSPPPQSDSVTRTIIDATRAATTKGIRIIPITPGVTDSTTESVARSIATATGGKYAFFTDAKVNNVTINSSLGNYRLYNFSYGIYKIIDDYLN